ncbi:exo-alpha-sialidase [Planctomycetales bacterium ZRK34]|nr:exo-alpha-sialidase [Planctomycetales bacterium ZRK34]
MTIPQDNWAGSTLLAPEMWAKIDTSWIDLSKVPGVVIDHQPAWSAMYIGSPSIAILPNGDYVASHDLFGGGSTFNEMGQTRLFTSSDRGKTWSRLPDLLGKFWGTLFVHRGNLYIIGARHRFGDTVIRRSTDGGRTWTDPVDGKSGLILHDRTHCAPQPVMIHNGRLWRAMEDVNGGNRWGRWFRTFMMSVPVDADLLDASNWTISNRLASDQKWADGRFNGWLEGNAVATPDGEVVNLLRTEISPEGGHVSRVHISADGKTATFDPEKDILDMPGGNKKFTIRFDPVSKHYWSLTNWVPPNITTHNPGGVRNTLVLICSKDLIHWTVRTVVLHHEDRNCHGFQYVDWVFDGDDIIAVSRTGYDDGIGGAHSAHDANLMTFHRVSNFRNLSWADSVVDPASLGVDVKTAQ